MIGNVSPGTGTIWMDDVSCTGNEPLLGQCPFRGWELHNCNHNEDVSITCSGNLFISLTLFLLLSLFADSQFFRTTQPHCEPNNKYLNLN